MEITYWEIIGRLVLAGGLGGMIGLERETLNRPAGLRTHMLVSLGAALVVLVSMYGFLDIKNRLPNTTYDAARVAAQVVSGIGFLGAGTIMREGATVRGLTTAASLWTVAGIGLAAGTGMYVAAIAGAVFVYLALKHLIHIERRWFSQRDVLLLRIVDRPGMIAAVSAVLARHNVNIRGIEVEPDANKDDHALMELTVHMQPKTDLLVVVKEIGDVKGVLAVSRGESLD